MRIQIYEGRLYLHYGSANDLPMLTKSYAINNGVVVIPDQEEADLVEEQAQAKNLNLIIEVEEE